MVKLSTIKRPGQTKLFPIFNSVDGNVQFMERPNKNSPRHFEALGKVLAHNYGNKFVDVNAIGSISFPSSIIGEIAEVNEIYTVPCTDNRRFFDLKTTDVAYQLPVRVMPWVQFVEGEAVVGVVDFDNPNRFYSLETGEVAYSLTEKVWPWIQKVGGTHCAISKDGHKLVDVVNNEVVKTFDQEIHPIVKRVGNTGIGLVKEDRKTLINLVTGETALTFPGRIFGTMDVIGDKLYALDQDSLTVYVADFKE